MSLNHVGSTTHERRDTPRVPLSLDAMVKIADRPFQVFRTRDLSLDGAFVELGPHRLTPKDALEVALKIPVNGAPQIYRFQARVTRIAPLGVGMVFDHVNTESYAALMDLVFDHQPKGSF
jgi:hypothetical protein